MSIKNNRARAKRRRARYLDTRAKVRRVMEGQNWPGNEEIRFERPEPYAEAELAAAVTQLDVGGGCSLNQVGLDPVRVAAAFADEVERIHAELLQLLLSPLGRVAESIHVWPEAAFAEIALKCLNGMFHSPDGLDARCEDLRSELNELEQQLVERDEHGPVDEWGGEGEWEAAELR